MAQESAVRDLVVSARQKVPGTALEPSARPNWTYGTGTPSARGPSMGMLTAPTPSTELAPSNRPNWTYGSNAPATPTAPAAPAAAMGPVANPNVPAGGSAEAQAFRAQQAAGIGPRAPVQAPAGIVNGLREQAGALTQRVSNLPGAQAAGKVLRAAGTAGTVLATGQALTDSAAKDSTARYAQRFGVEEPTGDGSIGDIAKFTALRAGGFASDLGNRMTGGLAGKLYRDNEPQPTTPAKAPWGGRTTMPAAMDPRMLDLDPSRSSLGASRDFTGELAAMPSTMPSGLRDGVVHKTLDANGRPVYSGTNVKEGAQMVDGMGRATGTQLPSNGLTPAVPGAGQGAAPMAAGSMGGSAQGGSVAGGINGVSINQGLRAKTDAGGMTDLEISRLPPQTRHEMRIQQARERGEMARFGLRESNDMARAELNAGVARRGQDLSAESSRYNTDTHANVSLRGQDIQHMGHQMSAASARAAGARDQMNKDREFSASQQERNRAATESAEKAWQSANESRFRTRDEKGNDVVDHQKVASFNRAVDGTLPSFVKMLEQTGSPEAMRKAAELKSRGRAALDPTDRDMLQKLFDKRELAAKTHGLMLGASDYVHSDDLTGYLTQGVDKNLLGSDTEVARNGTRIRENTLIYGADRNRVLPNWGTAPNSNLTNLR